MYYYYCVYICMYARARRTTLRGAFRVHHTHPLQTVSLRAPPNIAAAFLFFFCIFIIRLTSPFAFAGVTSCPTNLHPLPAAATAVGGAAPDICP